VGTNLEITAAQMAGLPGTAVSASCPAQGYVGIAVFNVSQWWWRLEDETGLLVAMLSPWTVTLCNVARGGTQRLTVSSDTSLPAVPVSGAAAATYLLRLELSALAVTPAVTTLANAMAANASVTVSNSPAVTVSGGTVSLAAGTQVGISGNVTVQGSVSISNTPAVTISGSGNTVQLASGTQVGISGNVTVQGSVSISNTPAVTISGSGNTVSLEAGTQVTIGGTATVEWTSSGPVDIQNLMLSQNNMVLLYDLTFDLVNMASGATFSTFGDGGSNITIKQGQPIPGLYDGYFIMVHSKNDYNYTVGAISQVGVTNWSGGDYGGYVLYGATLASGNVNPVNDGPAGYTQIGPILLAEPLAFNLVKHNINQNTGSTVNDTVEVWVFGIKAQITNPQGNPVQQQASAGSFDVLDYIGAGSQQWATGSSGGSYTLLGSGNYCRRINFGGASLTIASFQAAPGTATVQLLLGSAVLAQATQTGNSISMQLPSQLFDFGEGVANQDLVLTWTSGATASIPTLSWGPTTATIAASTPPVAVSVVG
jgi:hypothetical protein